MSELERLVARVSDQIDQVLGERSLLLEALRNLCDASQTDADTCVLCRKDLSHHALGCPVAAGCAAINTVEGR